MSDESIQHDADDPPIFDIEAMHEIDDPDEEGGRGGLRREGVDIPFEVQEYGNGKLPDSMLQEIGIYRHKLHPAAAAAFGRWRAAAATAGIDLTVTDTYRSYEEQVDLKKRKPSLAATPGRSVHGFGFAVDVSVGLPPKAFGNKVYSWLKENGPKHGWHLGRPKDEPWHWVYRGDATSATSSASSSSSSATSSDAGDTATLVEVRKGSKGRPVKILQSLLGIGVDGDFGPKTDAAVRAFQTEQQLGVDGIAGPMTWAKLVSTTAPTDRPELTLNSTGDAVGWVQRRLALTPDDTFAEPTDTAVRAFQTEQQLGVDGVVGPKTWGKLTS